MRVTGQENEDWNRNKLQNDFFCLNRKNLSMDKYNKTSEKGKPCPGKGDEEVHLLSTQDWGNPNSPYIPLFDEGPACRELE